MKTIELRFDNVGGMTHLYLFAANGLLRLDTSVTDGKVRPVLASGTTLYNIEVLAADSFQFSEQMDLADGGEVFDVDISGFIPRMDNNVQVQELEQGEWIAIHQDANGCILMSGSKDVPLRLISDKTTGTSSIKNATKFNLKGLEPRASLVVDEQLLFMGN